ncbi:RHS repeat protein [Burkholderia sp. LS-044]|uniref:RHS repeat-associated core domain-containing protein n=1 Tax=Burkholderia sp. LS-044 TaxID=1459967 RepID=UPI0010A6057F|nr:RHS repeat-associated core domain-containing protein [Burkholderia sp. LS-044]THJ46024.1 RHS repeat protein [Burkholderia sp. LS-044]
MNDNLAFGTPTLVVQSNRGAPVRTLTYNRTSVDAALDERIERTAYDPLGRVASQIDARLFSAGATPNFSYLASLSCRALRTVGVDAGTHWSLADIDGRPIWARDARATVSSWTYDALGRPVTVTETADGTVAVRDAWIYGDAEPDAAAHNRRGQCVRRYDPAGRLAWAGFTLTGQPLAETRSLLASPDADVDWTGDETSWAQALGTEAYSTSWTHDVAGAWLTQTDVKGNVQAQTFDVAGRLAASTLTLAGGGTRPVLTAIDYSAAGQVLRETAGNGVLSTYGYEPQTQRLVRLTVTRPAQAGRATVLQDLHTTYDPVGNVLSVTDAAQSTSYWRNQRVDPTRTYAYDALYQLISATGRETVARGRQGIMLPAPIPLPTDDSVYVAYSRTYTYDRSGNLTQIAHQGANPYTQAIVVSATRNHALAQNAQGSLTPADVDNGAWFDAAGNQQNLLPDRVQPLGWNARNRLQRVTLVQRNGANDDRETYQYGANGVRVRKHASSQTAGTTRTAETIILPGLSLRVTRSTDGQTVKVVEALQEIRLEAGRAGVRALHWETGLPDGLANDALRFSYGGDLIGSIGLELDAQAELISREEYYPYGGTAVWTARSQAEADTKYRRYSGQERDVTGLYDYGWRSYQPWLGRWLNPDPAGTVDGLNLYRMVRNGPISFRDNMGLAPDTQRILKDGKRLARTRLKEARDFMKNNQEKAVQIGKVFFGKKFDEQGLDRWKNKIDRLSESLKSFKTTRHIDYQEIYSQPMAGSSDSNNQSNAIAAVDKFQYHSDNNSRYFKAFRKTVNALSQMPYGSEEIAMTVVHELSHAVLDTEDFDARYARRVKDTHEHDISRLARYAHENIDLTTLSGKQDAASQWRDAERIADSFAVSTFYLAYAKIDKNFQSHIQSRFDNWQIDMGTSLHIKLPR